MMETKTIRIRLEDWKKIKKILPSYKGEIVASYFYRLRKFTENLIQTIKIMEEDNG